MFEYRKQAFHLSIFIPSSLPFTLYSLYWWWDFSFVVVISSVVQVLQNELVHWSSSIQCCQMHGKVRINTNFWDDTNFYTEICQWYGNSKIIRNLKTILANCLMLCTCNFILPYFNDNWAIFISLDQFCNNSFFVC